MPALSPSSLPASTYTLATRNQTNATPTALQVICAFPVSGQYGPGSRYLYYVLIAACVFARHAEWLRGACLAAALLFPAVAAIHGIVLASVHTPGAVDMDIYGAFQLCSIGILAAPVTVNKSKTYFNDPGRNTIFLWTLLILAGLLSLIVEFFRVNASDCTTDDNGNHISSNAAHFPYYSFPSCGLICNTTAGPFSPIRKGSANNIYVIPEPHRLSTGTATLLAAACCIPAVLWLVFMWNKILWINWKTRWGGADEAENPDEVIEGTNDATPEKMKGINSLIRLFLSTVEVPVFSAAVFAIVVLGEWNFWSAQVNWQTEPITSIGQWAPIAGTVFAVLGSFYILLAKAPDPPEEELKKECMHNCDCPRGGHQLDPSISQPTTSGTETRVSHDEGNQFGRALAAAIHQTLSHSGPGSPNENSHNIITHITSNHSPAHSAERYPTATSGTQSTNPSKSADAGNRVKIANLLAQAGNYFGMPSQDRFDDSEFKKKEARNWPEIPGERQRNSHLTETKRQYNQVPEREEEEESEAQAERAESLRTVRSSPDRSSSTSRSVSPSPSRSPRRGMTHSSTLPAGFRPEELQIASSSALVRTKQGLQRLRSNTLEVPRDRRRSSTHTRRLSSESLPPIMAAPEGPRSPTIVISNEDSDPGILASSVEELDASSSDVPP